MCVKKRVRSSSCRVRSLQIMSKDKKSRSSNISTLSQIIKVTKYSVCCQWEMGGKGNRPYGIDFIKLFKL